jgi:hypothetical protein
VGLEVDERLGLVARFAHVRLDSQRVVEADVVVEQRVAAQVVTEVVDAAEALGGEMTVGVSLADLPERLGLGACLSGLGAAGARLYLEA